MWLFHRRTHWRTDTPIYQVISLRWLKNLLCWYVRYIESALLWFQCTFQCTVMVSDERKPCLLQFVYPGWKTRSSAAAAIVDGGAGGRERGHDLWSRSCRFFFSICAKYLNRSMHCSCRRHKKNGWSSVKGKRNLYINTIRGGITSHWHLTRLYS